MILVDSTFVNSIGGKNILNVFLNSIPKEDKKKIIVFIDHRNKSIDFKHLDFHEVIFVKNNLFTRQLQYTKIRNKIKAIISFNNVPLLVKKHVYQITYFHQYFFLDRKELNFGKFYVKCLIKSYVIKILFLISKSDIAVQSDVMLELSKKIISKNSKRYKFPIFEKFEKQQPKFSKNFLCITSSEEYKNLDFLLSAFIEYLKFETESKLFITISNTNNLKSTSKKLLENKNIVNLGRISIGEVRDYLNKIYNVIHPSKAESFGLVLVEASMSGNSVIAPNLPYVLDVCNPSITFENNNINSLIKALKEASSAELRPSRLLTNSIPDKLLLHLKNKL